MLNFAHPSFDLIEFMFVDNVFVPIDIIFASIYRIFVVVVVIVFIIEISDL